jgi:O-acetyl-ADP-ribose deacetylase (regulator of RNase III)
MKIEVVIGNIVKQPDVEAIVNSANANLRLGSGVCQPFAPLELGAALITPGFDLPNKWVIHVRSAHYINNTEPERYMAFAIFSMLNVARENKIKTVAMPAIGTGMFKFPSVLAARITAKCLQEFAKGEHDIELIRICVVNEEMRQLFESALTLEVTSC